ncbi:MAG: choice-of-anchor B family protein, partial [Bacteroidia bacterium]|nr:choice-of-anchor B family protein [Bacteroidia bacterium]
MKKNLLLLSLLISGYFFGQTYPSLNVSMLGTLSPCSVNNWYASGSNTKYSSVIGWANPVDNKEYAIMGGTDGYYFIEVTNPTTPVLRDFEVGVNNNCLWREMKMYGNYCYMISDDGPANGFIIADLSYLPDSIHVVHKGNSIIRTCHTLFVDGNKLYCGGINTLALGSQAMAVYDLSANPESPTLLRYLGQDYPSLNYVHDMWVQNDTVFASCGNQGLHIYKFNTNNTFTELASYTGYVQAGYNHSSFRTKNKNTLVFCDEVPTNTVVKILDVSNLGNLTMMDTIHSNMGATPHNPYILGDSLALVAYYQDGLYLFDISNPSNVTVAGFFDTHYQNGLNNGFPSSPTSYMGAWAADPFLPSGNVLVSDMQNGLFVLDISAVTAGIKKNKKPEISFNLFPNPTTDQLNVSLINYKGDATVEIIDQLGRKVSSQ